MIRTTRYYLDHRPAKQRAAVAVLVIVMLVVILGFAALTIDLGYKLSIRAEAQNATDAAALAGSSALAEPFGDTASRVQAATAHAQNYIERHFSGQARGVLETEVEVGRWLRASETFMELSGVDILRANAVRVRVTVKEIDCFLAGFLGQPSFDVKRESVAAVGIGDCRLWTRKKLKFKDDAKTDSFDALAGSYYAQTPGSDGHLCSCGEIEIKDDVEVNGDVRYVKGGKLKGSMLKVKGDVVELAECVDAELMWGGVFVDNDLITLTDGGADPFEGLEDLVEELADEWLDDSGDDIVPIELGEFHGFKDSKSELKVEEDDSLNLPPGTYYFHKIKIKNGGNLIFTAPTILYIEKEIDVHDGSLQSTSTDPLDLLIYHAGKKIHIKGAVDLYAYILAPNAKVKLEKGANLFGALIAKEVEFKKGSIFHADETIPLGPLSSPQVLVR